MTATETETEIDVTIASMLNSAILCSWDDCAITAKWIFTTSMCPCTYFLCDEHKKLQTKIMSIAIKLACEKCSQSSFDFTWNIEPI